MSPHFCLNLFLKNQGCWFPCSKPKSQCRLIVAFPFPLFMLQKQFSWIQTTVVCPTFKGLFKFYNWNHPISFVKLKIFLINVLSSCAPSATSLLSRDLRLFLLVFSCYVAGIRKTGGKLCWRWLLKLLIILVCPDLSAGWA